MCPCKLDHVSVVSTYFLIILTELWNNVENYIALISNPRTADKAPGVRLLPAGNGPELITLLLATSGEVIHKIIGCAGALSLTPILLFYIELPIYFLVGAQNSAALAKKLGSHTEQS